MYNKTIIRFGFCDIQNIRGLGKGYQPKPSASADNPHLDLDYSKGWFLYDRRRSRIADRRAQNVLRSSAIIWQYTSAIVCDPAIVIADDRRR